MKTHCLHFVSFRDDAYLRACRVFGQPDFIHPRWDRRARREIGEGDIVVFATGTEHDEPSRFNAPDFIEIEPDGLASGICNDSDFSNEAG